MGHRRKEAVRSHQAALDLAQENLPLVLWTIKKFFPFLIRSDFFEDAQQEGWLGLYRASQLWELIMGEYSTYAVKCIKSYLFRYLDMNHLVHIPAYMSPSHRDARLKAQFRKQAEHALEISSLDNEFVDVEGNVTTLKEVMPDPFPDLPDLWELVDALPSSERRIIYLYFRHGCGAKTIGRMYKRSGTVISSRLKKILKKLLADMG